MRDSIINLKHHNSNNNSHENCKLKNSKKSNGRSPIQEIHEEDDYNSTLKSNDSNNDHHISKSTSPTTNTNNDNSKDNSNNNINSIPKRERRTNNVFQPMFSSPYRIATL